jgi:hypothetical protein
MDFSHGFEGEQLHMFHCHILEHETGMMLDRKIVDLPGYGNHYYSGFDSAEPGIRSESTSRTPETWRRLSTRESSRSSWLPLPKTSFG